MRYPLVLYVMLIVACEIFIFKMCISCANKTKLIRPSGYCYLMAPVTLSQTSDNSNLQHRQKARGSATPGIIHALVCLPCARLRCGWFGSACERLSWSPVGDLNPAYHGLASAGDVISSAIVKIWHNSIFALFLPLRWQIVPVWALWMWQAGDPPLALVLHHHEEFLTHCEFILRCEFLPYFIVSF